MILPAVIALVLAVAGLLFALLAWPVLFPPRIQRPYQVRRLRQ